MPLLLKLNFCNAHPPCGPITVFRVDNNEMIVGEKQKIDIVGPCQHDLKLSTDNPHVVELKEHSLSVTALNIGIATIFATYEDHPEFEAKSLTITVVSSIETVEPEIDYIIFC